MNYSSLNITETLHPHVGAIKQLRAPVVGSAPHRIQGGGGLGVEGGGRHPLPVKPHVGERPLHPPFIRTEQVAETAMETNNFSKAKKLQWKQTIFKSKKTCY